MRTLSQSQTKAVRQITAILKVATGRFRNSLPLKLNFASIVIGPPQCGKLTAIQEAAQNLHIPVFATSPDSWIPTGARRAVSSLDQIREFLAKNDTPAHLIVLSDIEGLGGRNDSSWGESSFKEIEQILRGQHQFNLPSADEETEERKHPLNVLVMATLKGRRVWTHNRSSNHEHEMNHGFQAEAGELIDPSEEPEKIWQTILAHSPLHPTIPQLFDNRIFLQPTEKEEIKSIWRGIEEKLPKWAPRFSEEILDKALEEKTNLHSLNHLGFLALQRMELEAIRLEKEGYVIESPEEKQQKEREAFEKESQKKVLEQRKKDAEKTLASKSLAHQVLADAYRATSGKMKRVTAKSMAAFLP